MEILLKKKIYKRCLTNSYKKIPQATETFKDSILPYIGSLALKSTSLSIEGVIPFPSAPIIIAHESLKSTSYTVSSVFSVAAIILIPLACK